VNRESGPACLGEFAVSLGTAEVSAVSLEGNGFYYNEVTGQLSTSDITLRAFYELTGGDGPDDEIEQVYLNAITHMSFLRVRWLLDGVDFDEAIGKPRASCTRRSAPIRAEQCPDLYTACMDDTTPLPGDLTPAPQQDACQTLTNCTTTCE